MCKFSRPGYYGYKIWRQTKGKTDYTVLSDTITINAGRFSVLEVNDCKEDQTEMKRHLESKATIELITTRRMC